MTETPLATFRADRMAYIRAHAVMAAVAMAAGMAVLFAMGNPYVWTGAIGGLAAIAIRGGYLASDELEIEWVMTGARLEGPGWRKMNLRDITTVRKLGSSVQVITTGGDKHLIKYLDDAPAVVAQIEAAVGRARA